MPTINEVDSSRIFEELSPYVKILFAADAFHIGDHSRPDIIDYYESPTWTRRFVRDPNRSNEHFDVYLHQTLNGTHALIVYPLPIHISTPSV